MRENCRRDRGTVLGGGGSGSGEGVGGGERIGQGAGGEWKEETLAQLAGTPSSLTSNPDDQLDQTSPYSLKTVRQAHASPLKQCRRRVSAFALPTNSRLLITQDKKIAPTDDFTLALSLVRTNPFQDMPSDPHSHTLSAHQRGLITHFKQLAQRDQFLRKITDMEGKCSVSAFLRENPIVEQFGDIVEEMRKGEERLQSQKGVLDSLMQLEWELLGGTHPDSLPTNAAKIKAKVERLLVCVRETSKKDGQNHKMSTQTYVQELSQFKQVLQLILNGNSGLLREYMPRLHPQIATICEKIAVQLQRRALQLDNLYSRLIAVQSSQSTMYSLQSVKSQPIDSKIHYCMQLTPQNTHSSWNSSPILMANTTIEELMAEKEEAEMEEDEDTLSARLDSHREILLQMEQIYELEQTNVNLILQKQSLKEQLSNLRAQQQESQLQLNSLKDKVKSIGAEYQIRINQNQAIRKDNNTLQQLLANICDLNDTLQNEFDLVSQQNVELAQCKQNEIARLKQQTSNSLQRALVLEKEKNQYKLKDTQKSAKLQQAMKLIQELRKQKIQQQREMNNIKETIISLKQSLFKQQQKSQHYEYQQLKLEEEITSVKQNNILLSAKLIDESAINESLKEQTARLTTQIIRNNQQINHKLTQIISRQAIMTNRQSSLLLREADIASKETALASKKAEILATTTHIVNMTAKLQQAIQPQSLFRQPIKLSPLYTLQPQPYTSIAAEQNSLDEDVFMRNLIQQKRQEHEPQAKRGKLQMRHCKSICSMQEESELLDWMQDPQKQGQIEEMRRTIAAKDKLIKKYEIYLEKYRGEARKSRTEILEMEANVRRLEAQLSRTRQELQQRKEIGEAESGEREGSWESEGSCVNFVEKEVELKVKQEQLNCKIEEIIKHVLQLNSLKIQVTPSSPQGSELACNPEHCE